MCIRPIILNCITDAAAKFQTWDSTSISTPNVLQNTSNLPGGSHTREQGDVGLQAKVKITPKVWPQTFNIPGGFDIWSLTFDFEVEMKQLTMVRCRKRNLVNEESMTIFPVFFPFWFPQVRWCVKNWTKHSVKRLMGSVNLGYSTHFASNEIFHMIKVQD